MPDVKLIMFKEDGQRKDIRMGADRIVIGRKEDCDLRIPLAAVSRRHCEISKQGDAVQLTDLGSSNGTFVNNKRVQEASLRPGDHVVIGPVVFTVQIDGFPAKIKPVRTSLRNPGRVSSTPSSSSSPDGPAPRQDVDPISSLESPAGDTDTGGVDLIDEESK